MPAFDPRDRAEVDAAKGNPGYGKGGGGKSGSPNRPQRGPFTGTVTPNKPISSLPSEIPGWGTMTKGLIDQIMGNYDMSDITGYTGSVQRDLGSPTGGTGNTGGRDLLLRQVANRIGRRNSGRL